MQFHKKVLSNGLRVLTIPMAGVQSATIMVMAGAGSRYETKKNNGISHFLEHMAFKGTKKRPTALAISTLIDGIGGEFNAFTGKETTGYYVKSASNHIELCLDVLSDMLNNSLFDATEIEKEKGVIIEEINLYEDTPVRKIGDIYEQLLYGDTPMGWDIAGEKDIIRSIKREDFIEYLKSLYSAHNMTVVVAGGFNNEKVVKMIEKHFGHMERFDTLRYLKVKEKQTKPAVFIKQKKTEQVHIAIGVRTVPVDSDDKYPLSVLASLMGGGMSSRLFSEVREKRGLGYYVRTHSDHYEDVGSFVSVAGIDPKRVEEAITVILAEYRALITDKAPISEEELKKAKEYLKGHLVLELEDSRSVASFFAGQELLEKQIDTPEEVIEKTEKVTVADVMRVAKKYLVNDTLNLAVIGDFPAGHTFEKLLKL